MTLVVRSIRKGFPVLIGDVLVTGGANSRSGVRPPTVQADSERSRQLVYGGVGPVELQQKIVCHRKLAFGWSGDVEAAEKYVGGLEVVGRDGNFSIRAVRRLLDAIPDDGRLALTGWYYDGNEIVGFNVGGEETFVLKNGCVLSAIGSGTPYVAAIADANAAKRVTIQEQRTPIDAKDGLEISLFLIKDLLLAELTTTETFQRFFGGAYEIVVPCCDGFSKLKDLEYVFWDVEVVGLEARVKNAPYKLFRLAYQDDLLVVAAGRMEINEGQGVWHGELFKVRPVYRPLTHDEIITMRRPACNASIQLHVVEVTGDKNYRFGFVSGLWSNDDLLVWSDVDSDEAMFKPSPGVLSRMFEYFDAEHLKLIWPINAEGETGSSSS